jgi:hypothetical protein
MIRRILKIFAVIFLVIAGTEIVFGDWIPPNYGALDMQRNEVRFYDVTGLYPGWGVTEFRTDDHGLRGSYGGNPANIDLLVIGNGTTIEQYVTEGETWPDYLQKGFRNDGIIFTIAAAGYHGQSTRGLIRRFDTWFPLIPGLKPKFVLAFIGSNELTLASSEKYDAMVAPKLGERIHDYVRNSSAIYPLYIALRNKRRGAKPTPLGPGGKYKPDHWVPLTFSDSDFSAYQRSHAGVLEASRERTAQLIRRIRAFGAIPVIANQHQGYVRTIDGKVHVKAPPGASSSSSAQAYVNSVLVGRVTMAACRAEKAICIDVVSGLAMDAPEDYYDNVHTASSGNRKIGTFIYRNLKPHLARRMTP